MIPIGFGLLLLAVCAAALVSVVGLALVQRLVSSERRKQQNDVTGFIFAVVGVVYAVLLGLVVVAVWGDYETTRDTTYREADELAEIFWLAHRFPEPEQHRIQELARSYARVVVAEEWPLMAHGRSSPRAWALLGELRGTLEEFEPHTDAGLAVYQQGLHQIHDLAEARSMRLVEVNEGIPALLWVVLVVGGIVTVSFTYLFGLESTWAHRLMVAALAGVIALVLFTIGELDYPFSGGARVGPGAFELVLDRFETNELSDLRLDPPYDPHVGYVPYSPNSVEVVFSEVRIAPVQHPQAYLAPNALLCMHKTPIIPCDRD